MPRYLARYVFRVAITEARIVGLDDTGVSIRHKHIANRRAGARSAPTATSSCAASSSTCCRRGSIRCATRGFWHPSRRDHAARARDMLALDPTTIAGSRQDAPDPDVSVEPHRAALPCPQARLCPCCKAGHLEHVRKLYPRQVRGP